MSGASKEGWTTPTRPIFRSLKRIERTIIVMAGLVPAIHDLDGKTWMPGDRRAKRCRSVNGYGPGMTGVCLRATMPAVIYH